jgi:hypothetical protein
LSAGEAIARDAGVGRKRMILQTKKPRFGAAPSYAVIPGRE